jgi:hypothetical protein
MCLKYSLLYKLLRKPFWSFNEACKGKAYLHLNLRHEIMHVYDLSTRRKADYLSLDFTTGIGDVTE